MNQQLIIKKKRSVFLIALIAPIVALIISYGMIKKHYETLGNTVTIYVSDVNGLDLRKSHIEFRGIQIGNILSIKPDKNHLERFEIKAQLYSEFNYLVKQGTRFWIVASEINNNQIENLSTILTGNYIETLPATLDVEKLNKLPKQSVFYALDHKPYESGNIINLQTNNSQIAKGATVEYKGITIGKVLAKELIEDNINYKILIYKKFENLLGSDTYFYEQSPVNINIDTKTLNLSVLPLKNFLSGSITLIKDKQITNKRQNHLYNTKEDIYFDATKGILITLIGHNISKNEKIYFNNFEVGYIKSISLEDKTTKCIAYIYDKYKYLLNDNISFYKMQAFNSHLSMEGLNININSLRQIIEGGIAFIENGENKKFSKRSFELFDTKDTMQSSINNNKYFYIDLILNNLANLKKTSKLYYQNIPIGEIYDIKLENNIVTKIKVNNKYKYLFGKDAKIYMEGIKISLDQIANISTTVLGDKLHLVASQQKGFKNRFLLDDINPVDTKYKEGLRVILQNADSKDIYINTPIYYKYIQIGKVESIQLNTTSDKVEFTIYIQNKYRKYIKTTSSFQKDNSIDAKLGLFKSEIKLGTIRSILKGGLIVTSESDQGQPVSNGYVYKMSK